MAVARHVMPRSLQASPSCAHVLRCARIRWLKASLLEPARSREGRGLFATQIRQPSRARCLAIEKQWNTLFHRPWGGAASYVPHLPFSCSHMKGGAGSSGADGIVLEKR
ncbi:hypothetical protein [Paenibacillus polymyxa]|uniref:hypothetical protein n=1 Tax=Paenibacillus polymyxa TaxID=1406 RepID=UPI002349FDD1|nr:hypothetical protein [Paenibacillus polymyxa]WCM62117.1 hypothetical protein OYT09_03875 [Paenibacillus polymyxa]